LREAVEAKDGDLVATAAHTLRGMLSNLAASQAAATAARLEQDGPQERNIGFSRSFVVFQKRCRQASAAIGRLHGRGAQVKILIADDEAMSRRLLQSTLERAGYEVIAVENGRQAADQICTPDGPRLALLDWLMPELDGREFAAKSVNARNNPTSTWC